MNRSKYVDGVEIGAEQLNFTEQSKIEALKRIVTVFGVCGPVKGCVVVPDANDPYKISVTAGEGYTYGGNYYKIVTNVDGIVISNNIGVKNYVAVKVMEKEELKLPHVITGVVYATKVVDEYEIVVLTEQQWLSLVDKDMYSLLAVVTGSGGFVRISDIARPPVGVASLLFVERQPTVVTGVKFRTVSSNAPLGEMRLKFRIESGGSVKVLSVRFKGEVQYGQEVMIGASGVYRLWNALGTVYVQVEVDPFMLPLESVEEVLNVIDLFAQADLALGTMKDSVHRGLMGSGMPSPRNPHGQTLDDLDPGVYQNLIVHRLREHTPGIIGQGGSVSLYPSIAGSNVVSIGGLVGGEYVISGGMIFDVMPVSLVSFSGSDVAGTYYIWIDESSRLNKSMSMPDTKKYFVICSVFWDGSVVSGLVDRRVWGSLNADAVGFGKDRKNDILDSALDAYTVEQVIMQLKFILGKILGGDWWKWSSAELFNLSQIAAFFKNGFTISDGAIYVKAIYMLNNDFNVYNDRRAVVTKDYLEFKLDGYYTIVDADAKFMKLADDNYVTGRIFMRENYMPQQSREVVDKEYVDNRVPGILYSGIDVPYEVEGTGGHTHKAGVVLVARVKNMLNQQEIEYQIPGVRVGECTCTCRCVCTCTGPCHSACHGNCDWGG